MTTPTPLVADGEIDGLIARLEAAESIIRDTLWMAARYAHGRQSYAVGMYNEAARKAVGLGVVKLDEETFAIDGSLSREMSGLEPDEFERAWLAWSSPNAVPNHCRRARSP